MHECVCIITNYIVWIQSYRHIYMCVCVCTFTISECVVKYLKCITSRTLLIRILKFIVMISLCTHFVACLWYILGCQIGNCRSWSWAGPLLDSTTSDADHYCNSLYWAVATMTTTGYGDLSATNVQVSVYVCVCVCVCVCVTLVQL